MAGAERLTERHDHEEEEQDECHEARDRDRPRGDAVATEPEHDQERHVHGDRRDRHDERRDLRDPDARAPRLPRGVFDEASQLFSDYRSHAAADELKFHDSEGDGQIFEFAGACLYGV